MSHSIQWMVKIIIDIRVEIYKAYMKEKWTEPKDPITTKLHRRFHTYMHLKKTLIWTLGYIKLHLPCSLRVPA